MRIFLGLLGMVIGFLMIRYSFTLRTWVGKWEWAEKAFGQSGTYTGIKVAGIVIILLSFLYITNSFDQAANLVKSMFGAGGQALRNS